jgi:hypothetical protein
MYLNLLLKTDNAKKSFYIPYTFIPRITDDYTRGQDFTNIVSMTIKERASKVK